ncbi:MAG: hypothetical protein AB7O24_17560 [Kofleriaceae bacterium]
MITPPEHCPEDCPPADADMAIGKIIRFVRNAPPTREDMKDCVELGTKLDAPPCLRCALSVLVDETDVSKARALIPYFRKLKVAVAEFRAGQAKLKQTGNNEWHHSLWLERTIAATAHQMFQVLEL